jgi:excisionase family DNA binding protein
MAEPTEILTIREVAVLLKLGTGTIYNTMAHSRELPGLKVGGQWRFRRGDIDGWIAARIGHAKGRAEGERGDR